MAFLTTIRKLSLTEKFQFPSRNLRYSGRWAQSKKMIQQENLKAHIDDFLPYLINCRDTDNLIIKGHILTEHALNFYINMKSIEKIDIEKMKFTYANKIQIAKILGLFKIFPQLFEELTLLNKLRNSLAHRLKYDEKVLTDFLKGYEKRRLGLGFKSQTLEIGRETELKNEYGEIVTVDGSHMMLMLQISSMCLYIYVAINKETE